MASMSGPEETRERLLERIEQLTMRLEDAENTLQAIRQGEVDALVVSDPGGPQVYTLRSADHPYRTHDADVSRAPLRNLGAALCGAT